jgi:acid ceramidase
MPTAPTEDGVLRLSIPLDEPPDRRWRALGPHADSLRRLVEAYVAGFAPTPKWSELLEHYATEYLTDEQRAELHGIAALADVSWDRLLLANLSYDALKTAAFLCTAFAVDTPEGPVHARNLDWFPAGGLLRDCTTVFDLCHGGEVRCSLVGWPGCTGAFTGIAPGRFSVSLNSAHSSDPVELAPPVVLLLRGLLENATYDEAVLVLSTAAMPCDCLLLVVGTRPGQMCVIERTPRRVAVRRPHRQSHLIATNDYRSLRTESRDNGPPHLLASACGRYDRVSGLLYQDPARDPFSVLADPQVRMDITVQHVVMCPATGRLQVRLPSG